MHKYRKTISETLFEQFLHDHGVPFRRIAVADTARPDYSVGEMTDWGPVYFEVKELSTDEDFGHGQFASNGRTVGDHIRSKITKSKKQLQYGAKQGIPSILLIYNDLDTHRHEFGTEEQDFRTAMYGEWTLVISEKKNEILSAGYGRNSSFGDKRNTSFTALGHLKPLNGVLTVQLFTNQYAETLLPGVLPDCFEIVF